MKRRIGIFDSGMGGLSVLHHAIETVPGADFIYYADEAHVPYGEKPRIQIQGYIDEIIRFMLEKKVDAIIIACNTATSVATREYRSRFPIPIIGMEPAVKLAAEQYDKIPGRILVAATPVTIAGEKLHDLVEKVDHEDNVDLVALPGLVRFAEQGEFESVEVKEYLKEALSSYVLEDYKAFVLGCTHFNYFIPCYRELFPKKTKYVDGNEGTVRQLLRSLPAAENADGPCRVEYYFSGKPVTEEELRRIERYMAQLDRVKAMESRV